MRAVLAGLSDPVIDSQQTFRAVLDALAEPGTEHAISAELPETSVSPAAMAILLTLIDIDTPLWLSPSIADHMASYIRFHTGAPIVDAPGEAAFALVGVDDQLPSLSSFRSGTAMSPESSTTVVREVADFVGGASATLDGPGFAAPRRLAPVGLDQSIWTELAANHARFPAGIDLLLTSGHVVVGLPRSTRIDLDATVPFTEDHQEG